MTASSLRRTRAALLGAGAIVAAPLAATGAAAAEPLRICASSVEAPYSMAKGEGFENRIAEIVAKAAGREAQFVWTNKPAIYLVRDFLDKNACDVVFGVDAGDERVRSTKPYFRTGYVYLSRSDKPAVGSSWKDIENPDFIKFAFRFYSPAEMLIKQAGKYEGTVSYQLSLVNFEDKRNKYTQIPADRIVSEVADGDADLGIVFASDVARYVKASPTPLRMTMIADDFERGDGVKFPLHFDQAIGVRKDDEKLQGELDAAIEKARPEIDAVLAGEGIPALKPDS